MIAAGANVDHSSRYHKAPLTMQVWSRPDLARILLEAGANPDAEAEFGEPFVFDRICSRDVETLWLLVKAGASLDVQNKKGAR